MNLQFAAIAAMAEHMDDDFSNTELVSNCEMWQCMLSLNCIHILYAMLIHALPIQYQGFTLQFIWLTVPEPCDNVKCLKQVGSFVC